MSQIVKAAIAKHLGDIEKVMDVPSEPFGYGTDLSCTDDLDERLTEVDSQSTRALAEAVYRRITTPRGSLPDDPDYGIDIRGFLNRGTTAAEILAIAGQTRAEIEKDDRVQEAQVTVSPSRLGDSMTVDIRVTPEDPGLGDFDLTLAVTGSDVIMEALAA